MTRPLVAIALVVLVAGCDAAATAPDDAGAPADAAVGDGGPSRPGYRTWIKVELPGTVCGNGSQYKFFVNYFPGATDTLVYFEAGGACWDYASCTGGERGAAHPDGIEDDLPTLWEFGTPFLRRGRAVNPLATWNFVFIPYCTGDVHIGRRDVTYVDPDGVAEPLEWHHRGFDNTQAVIEWMTDQFPDMDRLLVSGCSAGGAGAINNYYWLRTRLSPRRGYLLDDSGPIFGSSGNSSRLHAQIRGAWGLDAILEEALPEHAAALAADLGAIHTILSDEFPDDRLATTFFRLDYDYSLYSYERFYDFPERSEIYRLFWEDTQAFTALYDTRDNLGYYIPFYRELNNSHCSTLLEWEGTEIEADGLNMQRYVEHLLDDDTPLQSYLETAREGPFADLSP